jgi:PhzF family phenazine biosynthesis protein
VGVFKKFHQLDVFSAEAFMGNPLAVVHDADDLTWAQMASFARWTNLSETTFLMKPTSAEADYRVRIFTPGGELPFAGHPTLGSACAWLTAGGLPKRRDMVVQECGAGLVRVRRDGLRLAFAAPPLRRSGLLDEQTLMIIATGLKVSRTDILMHQWVDNGPGWCAVMLRSADQVLALQPDMAVLRDHKLGVIAPYPPGGDAHYEVRAFVPGLGVPEDPVTGSLNAGLGMWLIKTGQAPSRYVVSQGTALKRRGRIYVERLGDDVWVGGDTLVRVSGTVEVSGSPPDHP